MESTELQKIIERSFPKGAMLQRQRFGRSQHFAYWIDSGSLLATAKILKNLKESPFDWLENMSMIQMDDALVATYFLRSREHPMTLILRCSRAPEKEDSGEPGRAEFSSVSELWEMARPFEQEITELFGVNFRSEDGTPFFDSAFTKLPEGTQGFPLRKEYKV